MMRGAPMLGSFAKLRGPVAPRLLISRSRPQPLLSTLSPPRQSHRTRAKAAPTAAEIQMASTSGTLRDANRLKAALSAGKASIGAWQMLPGSNISRVLARTGVDWVLVDMEHGNIEDSDMHESVPAIAALGVSPIVRIPDTHGWMVKRALDSGAHGVVVPMLRTAEEARQLVQAAKFPPMGRRGFGSPFSFERFDPKGNSVQYLLEANDAILTIVQIETKEATENIDEIAAVEGIDVLFIGPYDLGNNLGHPILTADIPPPLKATISKILAATHKAGKKCGILATSGEQGRQYAEQGFDMISVTLDYSTLDVCTEREVSIAKGVPSRT